MWLLGVSCGDTWLFLPNLVEVQDAGACVVRLWSHVVAPVFSELLCLNGTLVVGQGVTLFRCFVVLCGRVVCFRLLEFLLLWMVRDWLSLLSLVHEAHPPTLFR
ncbi:hypothetical protein Taro_047064 [Colocasia esculenta]|uniref:Uncharacterized protein n=1 Tax=Colocasia esculenta TaxID=4460 RepID=A0A843X6T0_COLES|nr:hypothetical protein [Colocasia esculenta]